MKITKIVEGRQVVFTVPSSPAKTAGQQQYSPPSAASPFARIRQLLGYKQSKQSGQARCAGCGDAIQLQAATHQFYRGDQPLCAQCAGPAGAQLAQCYATVTQNPSQQYTAATGSVSVVQ